MAKAKGRPPLPELVALEERAAAIISSAVDLP